MGPESATGPPAMSQELVCATGTNFCEGTELVEPAGPRPALPAPALASLPRCTKSEPCVACCGRPPFRTFSPSTSTSPRRGTQMRQVEARGGRRPPAGRPAARAPHSMRPPVGQSRPLGVRKGQTQADCLNSLECAQKLLSRKAAEAATEYSNNTRTSVSVEHDARSTRRSLLRTTSE